MARARRFARWVIGVISILVLAGLIFGSALIDGVGGAFDRDAKRADLSPQANALIRRAYADVDPKRLVDYHVHVVGLGHGNTQSFVNPAMLSWWHPLSRIKFLVYASAAGIGEMRDVDRQYRDRLLQLIGGTPAGARYGLLGFDKHYHKDGTVDLRKTEFYVSNAYVHRVAQRASVAPKC